MDKVQGGSKRRAIAISRAFVPPWSPALGGAGCSRTRHPSRDRNPSCTFAVMRPYCTAFPVTVYKAMPVPDQAQVCNNIVLTGDFTKEADSQWNCRNKRGPYWCISCPASTNFAQRDTALPCGARCPASWQSASPPSRLLQPNERSTSTWSRTLLLVQPFALYQQHTMASADFSLRFDTVTLSGTRRDLPR